MADEQLGPSEEKAEFLQREEVRTMRKDITKQREEEAGQERERITKLDEQKEAEVEKEMAEKIRKAALERKEQQEKEQKEQQAQQALVQQKEREHQAREQKERQQKQAEQQRQENQQRFQKDFNKQSISPGAPPPPRPQPPKPQGSGQQPPRPPVQHVSQQISMPEASSSASRLVVRVFVVLLVAFIVFNIVLFGYWQLQSRGIIPGAPISTFLSYIPFIGEGGDPPPSPPEATPTTAVPTQPSGTTSTPAPTVEVTGEPTVEPTGEPTVGPVLGLSEQLQLPDAVNISYSTSVDLLLSLSNTLGEVANTGLTNLQLTEQSSGDAPSAQQILTLAGVSMPIDVSVQLQGETVFFRYTYVEGNRWGFVTEVNNAAQARQDIMDWEETIESNMASLSTLLGQKDTAYTTQFREKSPDGTPIRYQTFSLSDTGIVHAEIGSYVIFSNSYEATRAMIKQLQATVLAGQ